MKKKIITFSKTVLVVGSFLSWWVGSEAISLFLLGEYPYPNKDEY